MLEDAPRPMSDLIFKTEGKETFRIPPLTPGTKCPETKLEIKMTEPITLTLTLEELKLLDKYVEYGEETKELFDKVKQAYPQPRMEYQESGTVDKVEYNGHTYLRIDYDNDGWFGGIWWKQIERHKSPMNIVTDDVTRNVLEGLWYGQVKKDEPTKPMDEVMGRLENKYKDAEENSASYMTEEVIERAFKKWKENPPEFLKFELGKTLEDLIARWWLDTHTDHKDWDVPTCVDDLVDQIQLWLPKEQSHEGTQDSSVIDLVDGYNDALTKIKSKLRNKK